MNAENDMRRHFIFSQQKSIAPDRKIYTSKYFSLMLTMIILGGIDQAQTKKNYYKPIFPIIGIMIAIIIAFLITSFSQFIGHRRLYIISYILHSVLFILLKYYEFPLAYILFITLRLVLYSQIIIQIYGTWQHKFGKIFAQMLCSQIIIKQLYDFSHEFYEDITYQIWIAMISINFIWLVCGQFIQTFVTLNNFKSPETDSVFKDFGRSLCNIKIFMFTLLYFATRLSLQMSFFIIFYDLFWYYSYTFVNIAVIIPLILSIIILIFLSNKNLRPSLMILFLSMLLVSYQITYLIFFEQDNIITYIYIFLYIIYLIINYGIQIFIAPQYWQILINIGIRNLDFVSSYQLLAIGLAKTFNFQFLNYYYDNVLGKIMFENIYIIIPSLVAIIIALTFIFFQILGFKKYFRRTNISQVEEDNFQVEIV